VCKLEGVPCPSCPHRIQQAIGLDLPDWAMSYWGANLSRLRQIKSQYDPNNIFRHAQSVQPIQSASSR
jgi:FAD/FMN-containing dehydrogenase